jgi:hypothetical protein
LTGPRCTTLVKLPVALPGGSRADCAPLAGAPLSTESWSACLGRASIDISTGSLACTLASWVSLKLATIYGIGSKISAAESSFRFKGLATISISPKEFLIPWMSPSQKGLESQA